MKVVIDTTRHIIPRLLFLAVFILILIGVIAYARGYRFDFDEGTVTSTGILSVNSNPRPAKVYVNDELKGATDTNLTLPYGTYTVKVEKEGYTSWEKQVALKGEIVMSLNALLFPRNPSLTPLTNLGIQKAISVGNTDKVIVVSQTGNTEKDGLYLFESSNQPLTIFPPLKNLLLATLLPVGTDMTTATFDFHPNERQAIVSFTMTPENPINTENADTDTDTEQDKLAYLISLEDENTELFEVTTGKETILERWNEEKNTEMRKIIETLPKPIVKVASDSFHLISLSPDEKKIMYLATTDATVPLVLDPPLIGANQTPEERTITAGGLYIYDKKEDKNFRIPIELEMEQVKAPTDETTRRILDIVQWYPTSDYITIKEDKRIVVMQYDGENKQTVYAGPFDPSFFSIDADWNLIVILNLNPQVNASGDLYSVGIR